MSNNIILRPARRSDIPELARITNAANSRSVVHKRIAPGQDQYPVDYYKWRLNIVRQRFATPELRTIVAEDSASGTILGQASWAVEGSDTALYKQWTSESTWMDWIESKLLWTEKTWSRYVVDRSIDYKFLDRFMVTVLGNELLWTRPSCLHCHLIVVDPSTQSKGVGRMLIDWGKELAVREDLPLYLEATLEATGFYEKGEFSRLGNDVVVDPDGQEPLHVPAFVWEGKERQGRWLERDGKVDNIGQRWRWKNEVLLN